MRVVMKFGGTGVDSCRNLINVSELVTNYKGITGMKSSLLSPQFEVTDSLLNLTDSINKHENVSIQDFLVNLRRIHIKIIEGCIHSKKLHDLAEEKITDILGELKEVLGGIVILREVTPKSLDYLLSFGERLSASLVSFALQDKGESTRMLNWQRSRHRD